MQCLYFQQWGDIDYVSILRNKRTGKTDSGEQDSRGLAYIKYYRAYHASLAVENANPGKHSMVGLHSYKNRAVLTKYAGHDMSCRLLLMSDRGLQHGQTFCLAGLTIFWSSTEENVRQGIKMSGRTLFEGLPDILSGRNYFLDDG